MGGRTPLAYRLGIPVIVLVTASSLLPLGRPSDVTQRRVVVVVVRRDTVIVTEPGPPASSLLPR